MQATIKGRFIALEATKSGKGSMLSLLQEKASCEVYVPSTLVVPPAEDLTPLVVEAVIRPGYEGRGFQASALTVERATQLREAKAGS